MGKNIDEVEKSGGCNPITEAARTEGWFPVPLPVPSWRWKFNQNWYHRRHYHDLGKVMIVTSMISIRYRRSGQNSHPQIEERRD